MTIIYETFFQLANNIVAAIRKTSELTSETDIIWERSKWLKRMGWMVIVLFLVGLVRDRNIDELSPSETAEVDRLMRIVLKKIYNYDEPFVENCKLTSL